MKNFSMVELFSGIGAQAKAFSRVCKRRNVSFKTLKTCEWDIHAITGYYLIHRKSKEIINWSNEKCNKYLSSFNLSNDGKVLANIKTITGLSLPLKRLICTAIKETHNLIDVKSIHAQDIPNNLDVLTYSFPCQDLSNVGGFHRVQRGIDRDANSRSGLLWEVERVLKERKALSMDMPKFLILENVTSLLAKRHRHNFEDWKEQLRKLGYYNKVYKLNSLNLGVPQHRQRLLMLSIFTNNNSELENKIEDYLNKNDLEQVRIKMTPLSSILKLDYSNSKYFNEAKLSQPNPTPSRNTIWDNNLKIIDENGNMADHSATITTKQDRHPNSGNLYFDYPKNKLSKYRFLTPRECFLLMGFDENDYEKIIKNNLASRKGSLFFSRDKMYKLAGNSIVVNVLEQIFDTIVSLDELFFSNKK